MEDIEDNVVLTKKHGCPAKPNTVIKETSGLLRGRLTKIAERLSPEQRLQIIEFYFQNSCSVQNVYGALKPFYSNHNRPTEQEIQDIITKLDTTFTLLDDNSPKHTDKVRTVKRFTLEQRLQIIKLYYQHSCSVRNTFRALRPFYGRHNRPTEQTIQAMVTKFRTRFTLLDINPPTRMRRVRTEENIAAVSVSVNKDRDMSIRRRSQQLGLCSSTIWKILHKDLDASDVFNADDEEEEETRSVGRPATGAVNLNIVRIGRGQGRSKNGAKKRGANVSTAQDNGTTVKKRDRPSSYNAAFSKVASGKSRGRLKAENGAQNADDVHEPETNGASENEADVNNDEKNKIGANGDKEDEEVKEGDEAEEGDDE